MKKRARLIFLVIIVIAVLLVVKKKIELATAPAFGKQPVLVSVFYSRRQDVAVFRDYLAVVKAINEARVSTRVAAEVKDVFVDEGDEVKKEELLAKLDDRDILAKIESAKAALASAKENFDYWQKEYRRDEALFKAGAISEEEFDRAKVAFAKSKASLSAAEKRLDELNTQLDYLQIKSPYDGVVARRFVDPGDMAMPGRPLFLIEDRSRLKLCFDVPQEDAGIISKGKKVFFSVNGKDFEAEITKVFPSLDNARMLKVEVYIDPISGLKTGEYVKLKVLMKQRHNVVVVPESAIVRQGVKRPYVFVVEKGRLKVFPVVTGIGSNSFIEVKNMPEGIAVVKNQYLSWTRLSDGEAVKIRNKR